MRIKNLIAGTLVIGFLAMAAIAQEPGDRPGKRGRGPRGGGPGPEGGFGARHGQVMADQQVERLTKELTLTTEQQDKVRKLITAHHEQMRQVMSSAMKENADKIKELREQMEEARTSKDETKSRGLGAKMRKLLGDDKVEPMREKLITDIEGVLTAEQKPKFEKIKGDLFGMKPPVEKHPELLMKAIESLKLPAEREQKIRAILDEAKPKADAKSRGPKARGEGPKARGEGRKARGEGMRPRGEGMMWAGNPEVCKKMMDLLSPEEQAKVREWRPERPMGMGMRHGPGADADEDDRPRRGHRRGGKAATGESN